MRSSLCGVGKGWTMVGEVVVVFYRLKGDGVAKETKVVDRNGIGEESF